MGALAGIACGLVAALPLALLLHQDNAQMGHGIAAVAFAFLLIQLALLVVHLRWHGELLPFGSLAALSFLLAVVVAVTRRELRR